MDFRITANSSNTRVPPADRQLVIQGIKVNIRFSDEPNHELPATLKGLLLTAYMERVDRSA